VGVAHAWAGVACTLNYFAAMFKVLVLTAVFFISSCNGGTGESWI
jgi:hypothetical protein